MDSSFSLKDFLKCAERKSVTIILFVSYHFTCKNKKNETLFLSAHFRGLSNFFQKDHPVLIIWIVQFVSNRSFRSWLIRASTLELTQKFVTYSIGLWWLIPWRASDQSVKSWALVRHKIKNSRKIIFQKMFLF